MRALLQRSAPPCPFPFVLAPVRLGHVLAAVLAALLGGLLVAAPAEASTVDAEPAARLIHAEFLAHAPPPPSPVAVCVIDTGVTPNPDLAAGSTIIESSTTTGDGGTGEDIGSPWSETDPGFRHGTHVAEVIAGARNDWGQTGIWPHAKIISLRVFPRSGAASYQTFAEALDRCRVPRTARTAAAGVANLSLGLGGADESRRTWFTEYVADAHMEGLSIVAAAGNYGRLDFPASEAGVIPVVATTPLGDFCSWSARAATAVAALGCDVLTTDNAGNARAIAGTSFAAPAVSAVLAATRAYKPSLSRVQAEAALSAASNPVLDAELLFQNLGLGEMLVAPSTPSKPVIAGATRDVGAVLRCFSPAWTAARWKSWVWMRDGQPITGATSQTYTVRGDDRNRRLHCGESASNRGGSTIAISGGLDIPGPRGVVSVPRARPVPPPRPRLLALSATARKVTVRVARRPRQFFYELRCGRRRVTGRGPLLAIRHAAAVRVIRIRVYDRASRIWSAATTVELPVRP